MTLFDQNIPQIDPGTELEQLQSRFQNLDPRFITLNSVRGLARMRSLVDEWWNLFQPYADANFAEEFRTKSKFIQRCWELYLGNTLLNHGFNLGQHQSGMPDLCVLNGKDERVWIEAIAVGRGDGKDRVPETELGKVYDAPINEILLRLSSAVQSKHQAFQEYIRKGVVSQSEPCVIAINRSETELITADPEMPLILKALFGIGDLQITYTVGRLGESPSLKGHSWTGRQEIQKSNQAPVPMTCFRDSQFQKISAVLYCIKDIINGPYLSHELGENLCFVHNPFAAHPLPESFFPFGAEYKAEGEYLKKVRDGSSYKLMFVDLDEQFGRGSDSDS